MGPVTRSIATEGMNRHAAAKGVTACVVDSCASLRGYWMDDGKTIARPEGHQGRDFKPHVDGLRQCRVRLLTYR